jgi:hypothetical protein
MTPLYAASKRVIPAMSDDLSVDSRDHIEPTSVSRRLVLTMADGANRSQSEPPGAAVWWSDVV